jgi:hypothetical protein
MLKPSSAAGRTGFEAVRVGADQGRAGVVPLSLGAAALTEVGAAANAVDLKVGALTGAVPSALAVVMSTRRRERAA